MTARMGAWVRAIRLWVRVDGREGGEREVKRVVQSEAKRRRKAEGGEKEGRQRGRRKGGTGSKREAEREEKGREGEERREAEREEKERHRK